MKFVFPTGRILQNFGALIFVAASLTNAASTSATSHRAQEQQGSSSRHTPEISASAPLSSLIEENLAQVSASAEEIKAVLQKEPGLMVELKKWVAIDDTNRGQVIDDNELNDAAMFDRISRDQVFRGVATRLLQRYGYLTPKYNPGSAADVNQQLLRQSEWNRLQRTTGPDAAASRGNETSAVPADQRNDSERRQNEQSAPNAAPADGFNFLAPDTLTIPFGSNAPANMNSPDGASSFTRASSSNGSSVGSAPMGMSGGSMDSSPLGAPNVNGALGNNLDAERPLMTRELNERASVADEIPSGNENSRDRSSAAEFTGSTSDRVSGTQRNSNETTDRAETERYKSAEPLIEHAPNPFSDVPSLYDLYQKVSARAPELKLFGADALQLRTKTTALPMDLPAGPEYVLGPGDSLYIDVWGSASQRIYRVVDREGRISLPEVGPIPVSGRTMGDVQSAVQQALRSQFRNVSADISLARLRTVRVYVVGEVNKPGAYDVSSLSTPLNALITAGGTTQHGSLRRVRHMRGEKLVEEVDIYDLLLRGVRGDIARIEPGDTLQVTTSGPRVSIEGMVRRPAIYELRDETNLAEVLNLAGGVLPTASLRHIEVERIEAHEKRTVLSVEVAAGDEVAVAKQLESFKVFDGDAVRILSIAPATQDAVYLQGHVLRPGRYSYKQGMRLADLVASYADLMPEPDSYAEIIRLTPPDFHPEVEAFDLIAALANPSTAPQLSPLDTIRIYSKYDFENIPNVFVTGEVRRPGGYRTIGEVHLRDAVYQAGGLAPDASLENAQLIRYNADGSLKIGSIDLARAMSGDPLENVILQPRDRLMIQRKPERVDPSTVYLRGEVASPGRFPLTQNLTVRDLISLGGGLKRSAYTGMADVTRYAGPDSGRQFSEHFELDIAKAVAGDPKNNLLLRDGDVITIAQRPGWDDRGASVTIGGEVTHPGTYGIKPGERLSAVLVRAGYFLPTAYPQAAVFERADVRELQEKTKQELIERVQQQVAEVKVSVSASAQDQAALQQSSFEQRERVLEALRQSAVSGRMVIHLAPGLKDFAGSPNDIELRAGDTLFVPKRPEFVIISGQVYNANALTYEPRRTVGWYLSRAGGTTTLADKKDIFVVRADGSVVSGHGTDWWARNVMSTAVNPGDSIIVPEKAIGGSGFWKNLIGTAQIVESLSISSLALKSAGL